MQNVSCHAHHERVTRRHIRRSCCHDNGYLSNELKPIDQQLYSNKCLATRRSATFKTKEFCNVVGTRKTTFNVPRYYNMTWQMHAVIVIFYARMWQQFYRPCETGNVCNILTVQIVIFTDISTQLMRHQRVGLDIECIIYFMNASRREAITIRVIVVHTRHITWLNHIKQVHYTGFVSLVFLIPLLSVLVAFIHNPILHTWKWF